MVNIEPTEDATDTRTVDELREVWCAAGYTIEDAGEFNRAAVKVIGGVALFVSNIEGTDVASPDSECLVHAFDAETNEYLDVAVVLEGMAAVELVLPELADQAVSAANELALRRKISGPRM